MNLTREAYPLPEPLVEPIGADTVSMGHLFLPVSPVSIYGHRTEFTSMRSIISKSQPQAEQDCIADKRRQVSYTKRLCINTRDTVLLSGCYTIDGTVVAAVMLNTQPWHWHLLHPYI